ncbi:MAG: hypothetical protein IKH34_10525, partial [Oscillospiraceae bacterium]|nr:hypothetical protein [Oscillospiraceae bacterium]MBR3475480.1 hypothetical protein [Oscillospiraceae bacterium]
MKKQKTTTRPKAGRPQGESLFYTNIQLKGLNQGGYCGKIVPVMQGEEIHIHRRRKRGTSEVQKAKPG